MEGGAVRAAASFVLSCLIVLAAAASAAGPAAAQAVAPSLYLGIGTGTNLGGTMGAGVEVRVGRHVSASAAVGVWPRAIREAARAGDAFDFDVGVKLYPVGGWVFTGVNYGIINAEIVAPASTHVEALRKRRGFTFSLGLRTPAYGGFYGSGFAGVTSDGDANFVTVFDRRTFVPHLGLTVGYELSPIR